MGNFIRLRRASADEIATGCWLSFSEPDGIPGSGLVRLSCCWLAGFSCLFLEGNLTIRHKREKFCDGKNLAQSWERTIKLNLDFSEFLICGH
jgi:hypothetical protein